MNIEQQKGFFKKLYNKYNILLPCCATCKYPVPEPFFNDWCPKIKNHIPVPPFWKEQTCNYHKPKPEYVITRKRVINTIKEFRARKACNINRSNN